MFQSVLTAIWQTVAERRPIGTPDPAPEVARRAASMVVDPMELHELTTKEPVLTHWQRLQRFRDGGRKPRLSSSHAR